jgi:drug/metabolite transporter (DMT)-like permease
VVFAKYAYICAFLFSINVAMVPWIYSLGVSIFLFLFLRFSTTFILSVIVTRGLIPFKEVRQKGLVGWYLLLTMLIGLQSVFFIAAVKYMPVGLASASLFTFPLMTYIMEKCVQKKTPSYSVVFIFIVAIIGIGLLSQPGGQSESIMLGLLLALLSALTQAVIMHFTPKIAVMNNWEMAKCTSILPASMFFILYLYGGGAALTVTPGMLVAVVAGIFFAAAVFFYYSSIRTYGATRTANIMFFEPLIVLFIGTMAYNDQITFIQYIGVAMVALSSLMIERKQINQYV